MIVPPAILHMLLNKMNKRSRVRLNGLFTDFLDYILLVMCGSLTLTFFLPYHSLYTSVPDYSRTLVTTDGRWFILAYVFLLYQIY